MFLRRLLIRTLTPVVWRLFPERKREALQEFSLIEKDSGCQLLGAMERTHDPRIQALLFQQVLEEFHHADLFERACSAYSDAPLEIPVITRDALIGPEVGEEGLLDLVSYVHVGESAVNDDFGAYTKAAIDPRIRGVFHAASVDEAGHVESSADLLSELAKGDSSRVRWAIWKARWKRSWRAYVRTMRSVGEIPLALLLSALYFFAGPFVRGALERRLALPRERQLEIILAQLKSFPRAS